MTGKLDTEIDHNGSVDPLFVERNLARRELYRRATAAEKRKRDMTRAAILEETAGEISIETISDLEIKAIRSPSK